MYQAIGKPLTGYALSSDNAEALFVFGESYFVLKTVRQGEYDESDAILEGFELDLFAFGDAKIVHSGLVSQEFIDEYRTARDYGHRIANEHTEKLELKRLLEKYGTPDAASD